MATEVHPTGGTGASRLGNRGGTLRRLSTETKHALKTTEFASYVIVLIGLLIAGNSIEGKEGGADYFAADKVWLYATLLTIGYMVSRGLAKSGSNEPYYEDGTNSSADRS
jgi:hypothetical protein